MGSSTSRDSSSSSSSGGGSSSILESRLETRESRLETRESRPVQVAGPAREEPLMDLKDTGFNVKDFIVEELVRKKRTDFENIYNEIVDNLSKSYGMGEFPKEIETMIKEYKMDYMPAGRKIPEDSVITGERIITNDYEKELKPWFVENENNIELMDQFFNSKLARYMVPNIFSYWVLYLWKNKKSMSSYKQVYASKQIQCLSDYFIDFCDSFQGNIFIYELQFSENIHTDLLLNTLYRGRERTFDGNIFNVYCMYLRFKDIFEYTLDIIRMNCKSGQSRQECITDQFLNIFDADYITLMQVPERARIKVEENLYNFKTNFQRMQWNECIDNINALMEMYKNHYFDLPIVKYFTKSIVVLMSNINFGTKTKADPGYYELLQLLFTIHPFTIWFLVKSKSSAYKLFDTKIIHFLLQKLVNWITLLIVNGVMQERRGYRTVHRDEEYYLDILDEMLTDFQEKNIIDTDIVQIEYMPSFFKKKKTELPSKNVLQLWLSAIHKKPGVIEKYNEIFS